MSFKSKESTRLSFLTIEMPYRNHVDLIRYLSEQKLPRRMLQLQNGITTDNASASESDGGSTDTGEDCIEDLGIQGVLESLGTSPYVIGDLKIMSLGNSLYT